MAAQVEQGASADSLHIPKPLCMGAKVFLALLDQVHFAEGAGVGHFLRLDILRREQERLGIEQQDSVRGTLQSSGPPRQRDTERLLTDDVLACLRHGDCHLAVQGIGRCDADRLHLRILGQFPVIVVDLGDLIAIGERLCVRWVGEATATTDISSSTMPIAAA